MKVLLVAVNSKYIHSNPAIYALKAYCQEYQSVIETAEYTINQYREDIVADIYSRKPDVLAFSCYIWNIELVKDVLRDIHRLLPQLPIWLGGPEVSYEVAAFLDREEAVTGILTGEGEQTFYELVRHYVAVDIRLEDIKGLVWRNVDGIAVNQVREPMSLDELPFPYESLQQFENRIVYYESGRGCPFSCSYCLSSVDKRLRFRSMEKVRAELCFFLENRVKQVKFVDRTFNANKRHAYEIWQFLIENDNGVTNFHFEIAADLLDEEGLSLLAKMRPGQIQLEVGVQTVNVETIDAIQRSMDLQRVKSAVMAIHSVANIHLHLDLIAGLPYEDYESFRNSFGEVSRMQPEQLQLGFLKVLKGSPMYKMADEYGIVYSQTPPYEVLYTRWISYEQLRKLKAVEEMVEAYYNSGQFVHTLAYALAFFENPFDFYEKLAAFSGKQTNLQSHSRITRYEILREFLVGMKKSDEALITELLAWDLYARENLKNRPEWLREQNSFKEEIYAFYKREEQERSFLPAYRDYNYKQLMRMTHLEVFEYIDDGRRAYLFDYQERNPLNREAHMQKISF